MCAVRCFILISSKPCTFVTGSVALRNACSLFSLGSTYIVILRRRPSVNIIRENDRMQENITLASGKIFDGPPLTYPRYR
jgi:hypothetical protein